MSDLPLGLLLVALILLLLLSAFFSGSETSMMALNRYRLRHLARQKHKGAQRATRLLERPDRLIGVILLGNNFVNILFTMVGTVIALMLFGDAGIALLPVVLTVVVLIFAEVTPKTFAALHPERIAFPATHVLLPLLKVAYPAVWAVNWVANGLLRLMGVSPSEVDGGQLSHEELRTVVNEAGGLIPRRHQSMLLSILDLEKVTVDDIMVPRNEVIGIDLDDSKEDILEQLLNSQHGRLPVFRGDIDHVLGMLHMRRIVGPLRHDEFTPELLTKYAREPYFVPAGTPLHTQLRNFQHEQRRIALVVDEYGDIEGLVTLEDILEEIVGEFTSDPAAHSPDVSPQADGSYLIDGAANIRELNRSMQWDLPTDGPKTLNGLILEYLENIPEPGTSMLLSRYPVEIVQTTGNAVKTARIIPAMRRPEEQEAQA